MPERDRRGTGPQARAKRGPRAPIVLVTGDQLLVVETVAAALRGRGFGARAEAWPPAAAAERDDGPVDVGLALLDLTPPELLDAVRAVIGAHLPTRWVVLTPTPRGPLWGAVLDAGARLVLPSTTPIDEAAATVMALAAGSLPRSREQTAMREAWRHAQSEHEALVESLGHLTTREREVLQRLYAGLTVQEIADGNGVSVTTVRYQVRSVLKKLRVASQLEAVARYATLVERTRPDQALPGPVESLAPQPFDMGPIAGTD